MGSKIALYQLYQNSELLRCDEVHCTFTNEIGNVKTENLIEQINYIQTTTKKLSVKETHWLEGDIESLSPIDSKVKQFGATFYPYQIKSMKNQERTQHNHYFKIFTNIFTLYFSISLFIIHFSIFLFCHGFFFFLFFIGYVHIYVCIKCNLH